MVVLSGVAGSTSTARRELSRAVGVATAGVALLAALVLLARGGSVPVRSIADSYESDVFPAYNDVVPPGAPRAPSAVYLGSLARRQVTAGDTYTSEVFPRYGAFMNGGDESGRGQSVLRRAQSQADKWMRQEGRDWKGSEYADASIRGQQLVAARAAGAAQATARRLQEKAKRLELEREQEVRHGQGAISASPAEAAVASLARAESAARSLTYTSEVFPQLSHPDPSLGGEQLYIPDIYNDKIDPAQQMAKMMKEFSAIIAQITLLETQMACAAACSNSSVTNTSVNAKMGTLDVTFDDSSKNVSGGVLSPDRDDIVSMACLEGCGIDMAILNSTYTVEQSTRGKLGAILRAVSAEKKRMQTLKMLHTREIIDRALSQNLDYQDKAKLTQLASKDGGLAAAAALQREIVLADKHVKKEASVVSTQELAQALGSKDAQVHSAAYQASLAKPDGEARAWKPPPNPQFAVADTKSADKAAVLNTAADPLSTAAEREDAIAKDVEARAWKPPHNPQSTVADTESADKAAALNTAADPLSTAAEREGAIAKDVEARAWKPPPAIDDSAASARGAGSAANVLAEVAKAEPDEEARAWKPPPNPDFSKDPMAAAAPAELSALLTEAAAVRRAARARLGSKASALLEMPASTLGNPFAGNPFAQLSTEPAVQDASAALKSHAPAAHSELHSLPAHARQQSLLQVDAGTLEWRRQHGAAKLQSWLAGGKTGARAKSNSYENVANAKTELIDWTVDLSRLTGAGSANVARNNLVPPRDSVRHTVGV